MSDPNESKPPFWTQPPAYFIIAGAAIIAMHFLAPLAYVVPTRLSNIGIALMLAGFGLAILATGRFNRAQSKALEEKKPPVLITEGPYRFSRHPMYLGMVVTLAGLVLALGTLLPMLVVPVFWWLIDSRFAIPEEAALEEQFGDAYRAYMKRVRRWI